MTDKDTRPVPLSITPGDDDMERFKYALMSNELAIWEAYNRAMF